MLFPARRDAADLTQQRLGLAASLISRNAMSALQEAKANYPRDTALADMIEDRQAVVPTSAATVTAFSATGVDTVNAVIGLKAGAAQVMSRAVQVSLAGPLAVESVVMLPAAADTCYFVAPGEPIPALQGTLTSVELIGRKMAAIVAMREEIATGMNGGPMFTQLVKESIAASFDKIFFSAVETDSVTPSGLRFDTSPTLSGGASKMSDDISGLLAIVSLKATSLDDLVLVASLDIAIKIQMALPFLKTPVIASAGLEPGTLLAIATNALAVGAAPNIRIDVSTDSVIHMEDASPQQISSVGSPANTVAAPTISLFQQHTRALKVIFEGLDWKWRVASGGNQLDDLNRLGLVTMNSHERAAMLWDNSQKRHALLAEMEERAARRLEDPAEWSPYTPTKAAPLPPPEKPIVTTTPTPKLATMNDLEGVGNMLIDEIKSLQAKLEAQQLQIDAMRSEQQKQARGWFRK